MEAVGIEQGLLDKDQKERFLRQAREARQTLQVGQACDRLAPRGTCAGGALPPVLPGGQEHIQLYMVMGRSRARQRSSSC